MDPEPTHPRLRWRPRSYLCELTLKPTTISYYSDVDSLREAVSKRSGREVFLITRIRASPYAPSSSAVPTSATSEPPTVTWTIFKYRNRTFFQVPFQKIRLDGLPLGGHPLTPWTYILGTDGHLGEIAWVEDGYFARDAALPAKEPSAEPWIEGIVPFELANNGRLLVWTPNIMLCPSMDDLGPTLAWVRTGLLSNFKIKAGGSLHSWSRVAVTEGVHILPQNLKSLQGAQDERPAVYVQKTADGKEIQLGLLVRGGSGNTIREVNQFAWEQGLAFPVLSGFDGQTLGGMFNTGTHGSVITSSHLADVIISIDLVRGNGKLVRIEPSPNTGAVTDPTAFQTHFRDARLIQDDDYFHAALINMGTMGIVRSYLLRLTPKFHLKEVRTLSSIAEVKAKLAGGKIYQLAGVDGAPPPSEIAKTTPVISNGNDGGFAHHPRPAYHFEVLINPHSDKAVITTRHPLTLAPSEDSKFGFQPPGRDLIRTLEMPARFSRPALSTWFQERWGYVLVHAIDTLIALFPRLVPRLNDSAMDTLLDHAYIDRSFNVFNIGAGTNAIPAFACTIYVPLAEDKYLVALDAVRERARQFAAKGKHNTAPAAMRFVARSKAPLGVPDDSCAFEFIFTASTEYAQEVVDGYDAALRVALSKSGRSANRNGKDPTEDVSNEKDEAVEDEGEVVRVHWGQMMRDPDEERVPRMYPGYKRWREIRDELDPEETFLNDWQVRILPRV